MDRAHLRSRRSPAWALFVAASLLLRGSGQAWAQLVVNEVDADQAGSDTAQIALRHVRDVDPVLLGHRSVGAELGPQHVVPLRVDATLAPQQPDGVAQDQADHGERQQGMPMKVGTARLARVRMKRNMNAPVSRGRDPPQGGARLSGCYFGSGCGSVFTSISTLISWSDAALRTPHPSR